ncbi:hypothetical protein V8C40DRAFT_283069 [Trichoderma camerunense]
MEHVTEHICPSWGSADHSKGTLNGFGPHLSCNICPTVPIWTKVQHSTRAYSYWTQLVFVRQIRSRGGGKKASRAHDATRFERGPRVPEAASLCRQMGRYLSSRASTDIRVCRLAEDGRHTLAQPSGSHPEGILEVPTRPRKEPRYSTLPDTALSRQYSREMLPPSSGPSYTRPITACRPQALKIAKQARCSLLTAQDQSIRGHVCSDILAGQRAKETGRVPELCLGHCPKGTFTLPNRERSSGQSQCERVPAHWRESPDISALLKIPICCLGPNTAAYRRPQPPIRSTTPLRRVQLCIRVQVQRQSQAKIGMDSGSTFTATATLSPASPDEVGVYSTQSTSPPSPPMAPSMLGVLGACRVLALVLVNIPAVPGLKSPIAYVSPEQFVSLGPNKVPALDDDRSKQDRDGFGLHASLASTARHAVDLTL